MMTPQEVANCTFAKAVMGGYNMASVDAGLAELQKLLPVGKMELLRETLAASRQKLNEPMQLAIVGKISSSKSTLVNAILGKDIAPRMCRCIDTINVSLNATDAQSYDRLCHSVYGEKAFDIMLDFAKECVRCGGNVVLSIVDCVPPEQLQKAAEIARDIGAKLRVRKMI